MYTVDMYFPYDRRFVYPSIEEAEAAIAAQENRINLVLQWLKLHGAPLGHKFIVLSASTVSPTEPLLWCIPQVVYEGFDDDRHPVYIQLNLYYVLRRPDIALVDLSRGLGSDAPTSDDPRRRLPSKQITLEHWIEPEPFIELPPVPRPFGPHPDQFDDACMLANSSDQFIVGAQWTEPDETLWQKEQARRGFGVVYYRWRQISTV